MDEPDASLSGRGGGVRPQAALRAMARRRWWRLNRRGSAAVEFALVGMPFCVIVFLIFAISLHLYYQELLDTGLHLAIRQMQTGNAQNVANGDAFVASYLCPAMGNLVACGDVHVRVDKLTFATGQDYYNNTTGRLPLKGNALDLSGFSSAGFCNTGSSQFVLLTAIYVAPTLVGGLLPNIFSVSYGGLQVDAIMAQATTYTENYAAQPGAGHSAPSC